MSKAQDKLGDALLSVLDTAEQNGCTFEEMVVALESAVGLVLEWKHAVESLPFLPE